MAKTPEREPLPPGVLPNVTDTDPPPINPATVIREGYVGIDETKLPTKDHHDERNEHTDERPHRAPAGPPTARR